MLNLKCCDKFEIICQAWIAVASAQIHAIV